MATSYWSLHQLNEQQLMDLKGLKENCKGQDTYVIPVYEHLLANYRTDRCNVLVYDENQLVGFLSYFLFHKNAVEIALLIDPNYRRQRIALQLLKEVAPNLWDSEACDALIFSTPKNEAHASCLTKNGFAYKNSEYTLMRQTMTPLPQKKNIFIRLAVEKDISELSLIDQTCFQGEWELMSRRFHAVLFDPQYTLFVIEYEGAVIGKAQLRWYETGAHISDIAVLPSYRRKGFGSELLAHCVNHVLLQNKSVLSLDVETTNQEALQLYLQAGFSITNAYDFWEISVDHFKHEFHKKQQELG